MTTEGKSCPHCGGASGVGKYCESCGAVLQSGFCTQCGAPLTPGARFCGQCGQGPGQAVGRRASRPWVVPGLLLAGAMVVVLALLIGRAGRGPAAPAPPPVTSGLGAGGGTPPDISQLSPRERFDRLYNRVMEAAERGDTAEMARFTPMALLAYGMLDSLDADARYHAALLQLHSGGVEAAAALGDSIVAATPGHLFGYVVQATIAKWRGDQATLRRAYQEFNRHFQEEMARPDRPEYEQHRQVIESFKAEAAAGGS